MRGQFKCDVTWFCFRFDFVGLYARCGCYSIVPQIDCKLSTENVNNYK